MIAIQLFGAFRDFAPEDRIELDINAPCSIAEIKSGLKQKLAANDDAALDDLLAVSRIATSKRVMKDDDQIDDNGDLAILPPVSGG